MLYACQVIRVYLPGGSHASEEPDGNSAQGLSQIAGNFIVASAPLSILAGQ